MEDILNSIISREQIGIWWLGQGGFAFKTSQNKIILVDPYLSNSAAKNGGPERIMEIPIKPEEVKSDLVFCTHDHLDHTDPETLIPIFLSCRAKFIGPPSSVKHFKRIGIKEDRIIKIHRGEEREIESIRVRGVFAKHTEDSVGYVFRTDNLTLYITGDTEYDERLKEIAVFKPDIMLICINGKWGNMNADEAALLTKAIEPGLVIPMHYGMFKENTVDPKTFLTALEKHEVDCKAKVLDLNTLFRVSKKHDGDLEWE